MLDVFAHKLSRGEKLLLALSLVPAVLFLVILWGTWTASSEVCILGLKAETLRLVLLILSGISFQASLYYIRRRRAER